MKPLKHLILASALAASLVSSALANTTQYVHIVGAPAYRQNGNDTITAVVAGFTGAGLTATSATSTTAAAIESAKQNQWLIPNYATGINLIVNVTWAGSTAGFASVASGSITQKYIADGTGTVASPVTGAAVGTAIQPDFTLSDTFQATTIYNGTVKLEGPTASTSFTKTYQTLNPSLLGVEAYRWVASPGAAAQGLTNLTTLEAQLLYENGSLPLAFFTGKNSDENTTVYALSRDPGSGSRLVALAETGVGPQSTIYTYDPTISGGSIDSENNYVGGTITDPADNPRVYAAGLIPSTGVWDPNAGDTGYPSFGTTVQGTGLLQAITATPPSGAIFITYLNIDDSTEAAASGAEILSWNGISFSPTIGNLSTLTPVTEGQYTFWSYEQLFAPTPLGTSVVDGYGTNQVSFANALVAKFPTYAEVPYSALNVGKTVDGGVVTPNY
ncbi:MAG: hypothetical protein LV479_03295 [Methylacidiphilales bacterium]|nr:hypothetical protein [Candidatus Methylacidiphilales bacterium]